MSREVMAPAGPFGGGPARPCTAPNRSGENRATRSERPRARARLRRPARFTAGALLLCVAVVPACSHVSRNCTDVGCRSGINLIVAQHTSAVVKLCARGRCVSAPVRSPSVFLFLPGSSSGPTTETVTVILTRANHALFKTVTVRTKPVRPNGSGCEPLCYDAGLTLTTKDQLVPA